MNKISRKIPVAVLLIVVSLDQITKFLIQFFISPGQIVPVIPGFLNLTLTFNRGAAFGLFHTIPDGPRQILLALTTVGALVVVLIFLIRDYQDDTVAKVALTAIIGGALGNVIDRIRIGMVVDFIDVYYSQYHWPAFNVADSAICVSVCVLLLRRSRASNKALAADSKK